MWRGQPAPNVARRTFFRARLKGRPSGIKRAWPTESTLCEPSTDCGQGLIHGSITLRESEMSIFKTVTAHRAEGPATEYVRGNAYVFGSNTIPFAEYTYEGVMGNDRRLSEAIRLRARSAGPSWPGIDVAARRVAQPQSRGEQA